MKSICVITGSRAEYGLLKPLLTKIEASDDFRLVLIASAMHLSPEFGETYREIERDGFVIESKVDMLLSSDSEAATAKSVGLGVIEFTSALEMIRPDFVLLLGDRFESLAAAQAALFLRIPLLHLHGGESTEGALDEAIRHSITKMSHLHFVSTEQYRHRVIQLGESPERVFNVGALGVENTIALELLDKHELEAKLNFGLEGDYFLVTYHPATLDSRSPESSMNELLDALSAFPGMKLIITYPNADTHGRRLIPLIHAYADANPNRVFVSKSLGQHRYLSAMKHSKLVIGNSSSGIIEAPSLNVPSINIGTRQNGRVQSPSVLNCAEDSIQIEEQIRIGLSDDFQSASKRSENPYYKPGTSTKILELVRRNAEKDLLVKKFNDIQFES